MFKKFRKAMAPAIAKAAAKEAPAPAAKPVEPMVQKAAAPAPAKAAPPPPMGGSGRGFFGKIQQAARQIRPALKEAAPAMKKNFETNPAKAVAGGARGIGKQVVRGIRRMGFKEGGPVSSGRGDGIAVRGKTKCKMS
jgi:hypothetical protein